MALRKPDLESVSRPESLVVLLRGFYDALRPSGALLPVPTLAMVKDAGALLVCITKFYAAAFIMGAVNLPRPTSLVAEDRELLTRWLVKLYGALL